MTSQSEYSRRNIIHCKTVGVRSGLKAAMARLEKQSRYPKWLMFLLQREYAKMDDICHEAVLHRLEVKEAE